MKGTRVYKRKGQTTPRSVTISLSYRTAKEAQRVAKALDRMKSKAACLGVTLSDLVGRTLHEAAKEN